MSLGLESLLIALRESGLTVGVTEVARLRQVFAPHPRPSPSSPHAPAGRGETRRSDTSPQASAAFLPSPGERAGGAGRGAGGEGLLRAVLVKSVEDRAVFDRVFAAWLAGADRELSLREPSPASIPPPPSKRKSQQPWLRRHLWRVVAAAALGILSFTVREGVKVQQVIRPIGRIGPIRPIPQPKPPQPPALTRDDLRKRTFTAWVPTLTVTPAEPVWEGWVPLVLGLVALTAAGGLWTALRKRRWFPQPEPAPTQKGPPRTFLTPPQLAGPQLLAPREEEALVWGIGQFVSEEPTRRLDLPATVRATARAAGIPHLRFHQARYPREVWLWVDETADDPALQRLADEVESALQAHSLPVERALFRGLPDRLVNAAGQVFAPNEVDERRDAALVAILTDGRILSRHYAADDRKVGLDALLRSLSHWPRLAFVDFAAEPSELAAILPKHSLTRISPAELAAFLGSDEALRRRTAPAGESDAVWAAGCALAPSSIDELRAFELRRRLGLKTSPWGLRALRDEAPGPPGRLQWGAPKRAERINWLRESEQQEVEELANGSVLGRALVFWKEVYDRELGDRSNERVERATGWVEGCTEPVGRPPERGERSTHSLLRSTGSPERSTDSVLRSTERVGRSTHSGDLSNGSVDRSDTPAHQHLRMERALLSLWRNRDAPAAVRELYRLHAGALREPVEHALRAMAPLNWGGPDLVHLPWDWETGRSGVEKVMLQEMKLGGGMPAATVQKPGRLWVGLGVCLGLAFGGLLAAVLSGERSPVGAPVILHGPGKPEEAWESRPAPVLSEQTAEYAEEWAVAVGTHKLLKEGVYSAGARVGVRWEKKSLRCVAQVAGREVWRCGRREAPNRLDGAGNQRVVRLESPPGDSAAESFALDLLDTGSADVVVIGGDPSSSRTLVLGQPFLAFPAASSWQSLSQALRFMGIKTVEEVWPAGRYLAHDPKARIRGLYDMEFVDISGGTFTMGSEGVDPDEQPAHKVTLSAYLIGKYEVTEEQFRGEGSDTRPAVNVSWYEAKAFCESHGWRLPTEAEWEYAARAGTTTTWSFGDDERLLGGYAWFEGNSNAVLHPVGTRKPNSWGIYDIYGNAWEWVADWYENYPNEAQVDPPGPPSGEARVLRGGAFNGLPEVLRSANRFRNQPSYRYWNFGFRCARSPHPPAPSPIALPPTGRGGGG